MSGTQMSGKAEVNFILPLGFGERRSLIAFVHLHPDIWDERNPGYEGINVLPDAIRSRRVIDSRGTKVDSTDTYEMAVAVTYALKSILQCIGRHIRQSKELVLVFTGIFSRVTTVC
ncbi:hypothetical protein Q1695_006342 [Nippostrongylus brasiliensis]|nr:hypothetical protein Q1695_006342 [Nippostrongylus brasiliensis]